MLVKNKLTKFFDVVIFIKAKKKIRLKRFKKKGASEELFNFLNNKQLSDSIKTKFSDHVIVNEKNINICIGNIQKVVVYRL